MRPRTAGRRLALQYLFMSDLNRFHDVETVEEFFAEQRRAEAEAGGNDDDLAFDKDDPHLDEAEGFAAQLLTLVKRDLDKLDREIEVVSDNWKLSRMGVIERNVLRLALAEIKLGETHCNVIIDEAVKLGKRFGDQDSGAFINGIADRLAKK